MSQITAWPHTNTGLTGRPSPFTDILLYCRTVLLSTGLLWYGSTFGCEGLHRDNYCGKLVEINLNKLSTGLYIRQRANTDCVHSNLPNLLVVQ